MTSEIETYEFNSADAMRVSKPSLQITVMFRLSIFGGFNSRQKFWRFLKSPLETWIRSPVLMGT